MKHEDVEELHVIVEVSLSLSGSPCHKKVQGLAVLGQGPISLCGSSNKRAILGQTFVIAWFWTFPVAAGFVISLF